MMIEKFEQNNKRISADRVIEMLENLKVDPNDVEEFGKMRAEEKAQGKILCDPNLNSETLDELAYKVASEDDTGGVRADIIRNPNVSEETILTIAKDPDLWPRAQVAIVENGNPKATPEIITLIAQKAKDPVTLPDIGRHQNTPIEVLEKLSENPSPITRFGVAENPNMTSELFEKLANDEYWYVRSGIAEHTDAPPHIRAKLAKDDHWFVRIKIAESEQSPEALTDLANDKDEYVRSAVLKNPNTPPEIKENLEKNENPNKMRKEVRMVLEAILKHLQRYFKNGMRISHLFNFQPQVYHCPLIDDSGHYGRTSPMDPTKSATATMSEVIKTIKRSVPEAVSILEGESYRSLPTETVTAILKAALGIGPAPDLSDLE